MKITVERRPGRREFGLTNVVQGQSWLRQHLARGWQRFLPFCSHRQGGPPMTSLAARQGVYVAASPYAALSIGSGS